jgi:hypothetical protein
MSYQHFADATGIDINRLQGVDDHTRMDAVIAGMKILGYDFAYDELEGSMGSMVKANFSTKKMGFPVIVSTITNTWKGLPSNLFGFAMATLQQEGIEPICQLPSY